jgi:hypothetical protein
LNTHITDYTGSFIAQSYKEEKEKKESNMSIDELLVQHRQLHGHPGLLFQGHHQYLVKAMIDD